MQRATRRARASRSSSRRHSQVAMKNAGQCPAIVRLGESASSQNWYGSESTEPPRNGRGQQLPTCPGRKPAVGQVDRSPMLGHKEERRAKPDVFTCATELSDQAPMTRHGSHPHQPESNLSRLARFGDSGNLLSQRIQSIKYSNKAKKNADTYGRRFRC
jgi:hypothetical protein